MLAEHDIVSIGRLVTQSLAHGRAGPLWLDR